MLRLGQFHPAPRVEPFRLDESTVRYFSKCERSAGSRCLVDTPQEAEAEVKEIIRKYGVIPIGDDNAATG